MRVSDGLDRSALIFILVAVIVVCCGHATIVMVYCVQTLSSDG